ncbi:MAG: hypothetical protein JWR04_2760 [Rhodoglobus sp.]|nr:hypothetical protein [Rhodoglobus sp.]
MKMLPVTSEAMRAVGYEPMTLQIEFIDSDVYRYFEVPEFEYLGLIHAESMGKYFAEHIRDNYRFTRVG